MIDDLLNKPKINGEGSSPSLVSQCKGNSEFRQLRFVPETELTKVSPRIQLTGAGREIDGG